MHFRQLSILALSVAAGLALAISAQAEVTHRHVNELNQITTVSDDNWQPENFVNGTEISAPHLLVNKIVIDGIDDEPEWRNAHEVTVPLSYGNVKNVSLKALYSDDDVFIRVKWKDDDENRLYKPWVWDEEQEAFTVGTQLEDSVMLSFEAGCEWTPSLLSGYIYDFDAWHWLAGRSDPAGQALDLYGSIQDRFIRSRPFVKYESRIKEDIWNLKFIDKNAGKLNADWNELDRVYMFQPVTETIYYTGEPDWDGSSEFTREVPAPAIPPTDPLQAFKRFEAVPLEGGSAEVMAKGHWEDGYWTVEFRRMRITPARHIYDATFDRLAQFSVHIFDQAEAIDESAESGRLFLRFLPPEQMLVKK